MLPSFGLGWPNPLIGQMNFSISNPQKTNAYDDEEVAQKGVEIRKLTTDGYEVISIFLI